MSGQSSAIGFTYPCPNPASSCKITVNGPDSASNNRFDMSYNYYLLYGTLVFKDSDTGEYLFDRTGNCAETIPCQILDVPDIPNNLAITNIDNFALARAKKSVDTSAKIYYAANTTINFDIPGWLQLVIYDNVSINGRLHTTDVDGERRTFSYYISEPKTLVFESNVKNIIVVNN